MLIVKLILIVVQVELARDVVLSMKKEAPEQSQRRKSTPFTTDVNFLEQTELTSLTDNMKYVDNILNAVVSTVVREMASATPITPHLWWLAQGPFVPADNEFLIRLHNCSKILSKFAEIKRAALDELGTYIDEILAVLKREMEAALESKDLFLMRKVCDFELKHATVICTQPATCVLPFSDCRRWTKLQALAFLTCPTRRLCGQWGTLRPRQSFN